MKSLIPALLGALFLVPAARADDAAPPATQGPARNCALATGALVTQDQGEVTISCTGVSEEFGNQLAGILAYVAQNRLDPEIVLAKLGEIEGVPEGDEPRNLSADQGQALVQSLIAGKPAAIAITADPDGPEAGDYALAIATRLGMAGWQVEGSQIRRTASPGLVEIHGLALVVRDPKSPPEKATQLKKAMTAAKLSVPIVARADMAPEAALLWVGKRPTLDSPTQ